ncbi:MAG: helix-turn-helix domain-containing protein [Bacteroidetes bacterium]|nr:helix-turn-helix domain-containing protein [Bacteroidota bacterium]
MDKRKQKRLEARGWRVGEAPDFLQLSPEESALIELRLRLSDALGARRKKLHLTQSEFAKLLRSSQSRVAKIEAGDPSVSLDLLIRGLLALGATPRDLARAIRPAVPFTASV